MIVDVKQNVVSDSHVETQFKVDYYRENNLYTCIIRLTNGFEAIGQIDQNYQPGLTDAQYFNLAHHKALKYAEMHGYTLV